MSSLEKCWVRSSTHFFFFLILSCMNCLYILEINHLLCLQILSPILRVVFCLIVSFAVQKVLSLIRSYLFLFLFSLCLSGSKKILLWFISQSVLPMVSFKSFIVSGLTFRSLIHSEFLFVVLWNVLSFFFMWLSSFPTGPAGKSQDAVFDVWHWLVGWQIFSVNWHNSRFCFIASQCLLWHLTHAPRVSFT